MKKLFILFCWLLTLPSIQAAPPSQPNILIILADDLGNADLSYNGCKDFKTPHIDKLAESGLILTDAHTSASVCAPSRAGLLSGKYQQRFRFESNSPPQGCGMPGSVTTFAEAMKTSGYQTMALGKWHLGSMPEMHPNQQGFDFFSGFLSGGRHYFPVNKKLPKNHLLQRNGKQVPESDIHYLTNWLTNEAIRLIRKRDTNKPFFMYLAYNAPHTPMEALREDIDRFPHISNKKRRIYAAMVTNLDTNIGKLLTFLEKNKLRNNTLIIFASDNGGATTNQSDNGIYRGMKGSKWEGGHRVPCIFNWPAGNLTGGRHIDILTSTLDFMPTCLAAAGKTDPIKKLNLDGINLLPEFQKVSKLKGHNILFFRRAVAAGVRDGSWKLIRVTKKNGTYRYLLFDLSKDIGETNNLTKSNPSLVKKLAAKLIHWEKSLPKPAWDSGEKWKRFQRLKHRMNVIGRDAERKLP